jgi:hypothetical protein
MKITHLSICIFVGSALAAKSEAKADPGKNAIQLPWYKKLLSERMFWDLSVSTKLQCKAVSAGLPH